MVERFVAALLDRGYVLWVRDGRVGFQVPEGLGDAALEADLCAREAEVAAFIGEGRKCCIASSAQQRMLFDERMADGLPVYNLVESIMRARGPLDIPLMLRCYDAVYARHESLRTVFAEWDGRLVQVVRGDAKLEVARFDVSDADEPERAGRALEIAARELRAPLDVESGPLFRLVVIRLSDEDYVVAAPAHHAVLDGWSYAALLNDLNALYTAGQRGDEAALPPVTQYADHVQWQIATFTDEAVAQKREYWTKALGDEPPALNLPIDRPRPMVAAYAGARVSTKVSEELTQRLNEASAAEGLTPYMLLLAAFEALLYHYTQQESFVVGSVASGRTRARFRNTLGMLVNTLAMRAEVSGAWTFRELLARTRAMARGAYVHQDLPFDRVLDAVQRNRADASAPLIQAMFVLENLPLSEFRLGDCVFELPAVAPGTAKFELTFVLMELDGALNIHADYRPDLFDRDRVDAMLASYLRILEAVARDREIRVAELPVLDTDAARQVLTQRQGPEQVFAASPLVHEAVGRYNDDRIAVEDCNGALSYAELNARANRLARLLARNGAGPERIVAVLMERSTDYVVALLAVLRAGAAYLPIDSAYPAGRVAYMLEDSEACAVVTTRALRGLLPEHVAANAPCVDELDETLSSFPPTPPDVSISGDTLAYVIYTSGSTGQPKGVAVEHKSLLNLIHWHNAAFGPEPGEGMGRNDRATLVAGVAFDASVWELWPYLFAGASVHIPDPDTRASHEALRDWLVSHRITVSFLPTPLAEAVLTLDWPQDAPLRYLLTGGDTLHEYPRAGLPFRLVNNYGPTENTVVATSGLVDAVEPGVASERLPSIGYPIANNRVYILGKEMQPVPPGVAGELYVGGKSLARGYLGRPELTAERFVPNPYCPGERLYRTGDWARHRADGRVEFLGRLDHQVKIRGYRIELGEIENRLRQHEQIADAIVVAQQSGGAKRLVAYVVARDPGLSSGALTEHVREQLPDYMTPSAFVFMDALPLTPNGKVDRQALPMPEFSAADAEQEFVAPESRVEETLAAIWCEVLGASRVGRYDNFFDLGGDSILSLRVVARARAEGVKFSPKDLFASPTIAGLARVASVVAKVVVPETPVTGVVPLTAIQRWFFAQRFEEQHHWNQAISVLAREALDADAVRKAVETLVVRHDMLRARYMLEEGAWRQELMAPDGNVPFEEIPLEELEGDAYDRAVLEVESSLDLAKGPVFRVVQFRAPGMAGSRLLIVAHHLVVDAVSWPILLEDLFAAYQAASKGLPAQLPPKGTSFQDWARRLAADSVSDDEAQYWDAIGADFPVLPRDAHGSGCTEADARSRAVSLTRDDTARLVRASGDVLRSSVQELLLAACVRAIAEWTKGARVAVDLEGHGREHAFDDVDVSRTVGWFTALYPMVFENTGTSALRQLRSVKQQMRDVPRGGVGYGLRHYRLDGGEPLVAPEISVNYLGRMDFPALADLGLSVAMEPVGRMHSGRAKRPHLLDITAVIVDGCLRLEWTYDGASFNESTIESGLESCRRTLMAFADVASTEAPAAWLPSDFELAGLDAAGFETLARQLPPPGLAGVADVYPLTPAQEGILFHSVLQAASGVYCVQTTGVLEGALDVARFAEAWRRVIARHAVYRSAYHWEGLARPLQVVYRAAAFEVPVEDWSAVPASERGARLDDFLAADRQRGFDLARPPLMRATLLRMAEDRHQFVWTCHHVLIDGWSVAITFREVLNTYAALCGGTEASSSAVPAYRNFIAWREGLARDVSDAYWTKVLDGISHPTPVPFEYASGDLGHGETEWMASAKLTAELREFARKQHLTLNTLFASAWALLLSRYTREDDVVFGTTLAARPPELDGAEATVGLFINTLPFRVKAPRGAETVAWLRGVQDDLAELRQHEQSALSRVMELSKVARGTALFDTLFVYENYPTDDTLVSGHAGVRLAEARSIERTNYALTFAVTERPDLAVKLMYDASRIRKEDAARILRHMESVLARIMAHARQPLSAFAMLTDDERQEIVVAWNDTAQLYPAERCVHELFERQVALTPEAVAVCDEAVSLTYAELNARANRLAHCLREAGVGRDALVGLCLERGAELIVATLAVLKAGGAYVPLDTSYPAERIRFMIEDTGIRVAVSQESLKQHLEGLVAELVLVDTHSERIARADSTDLPNVAQPDSLAYIIYTSGSTGTPKGICIPHRAINRLVCNTDYVHLGPNDVMAQVSNASFDAATFEIWGALLSGARLVVVPRGISLEPRAFADYLRAQGITTMFLTTALFNQLAREIPGIYGTLTNVLFGGEAVDPAAVRLVLGSGAPPARLLHVYGPTETTTFATWHLVREVDTAATTVPIGKPIANTTAHVLDEDLHPVPARVPGELYLGGPGLARGYWNRPELTPRSFVPNPFSQVPGSRLYKTGDLVAREPNGEIVFLGRIDSQVKVRGFRIELGEIEAALRGCDGVQDAAVIVRENERHEKRLVAYVVGGDGLDTAAIKADLQQRLPVFMVPSSIVRLDALPLTPNGKVDRRALPEPSDETREDDGAKAPPETDTERRMAALWAEVLSVGSVGVDEDFFALGGHSLLAMRLVHEIEREFGYRLPLAAFFEAPTVRGLSRAVEAAPSEPQGRISAAALQPRGFLPPLFCLPGIRGEEFSLVALAERLGDDRPFYVLAFDDLSGPIESMESLAAEFVQAIRRIQPEGPYHLGGVCFGGVLAYEIAQQLAAQGQRVALLALFEAYAPLRTTTLKDKARFLMDGWHSLAWYEMAGLLIKRLRQAKQHAVEVAYTRYLPARLRGKRYLEYSQRLDRRIREQALGRYAPSPYAGAVRVFRATAESEYMHKLFGDSLNGWSPFCSDIIAYTYGCGHAELMVPPHVDEVAEALRRELARQ